MGEVRKEKVGEEEKWRYTFDADTLAEWTRLLRRDIGKPTGEVVLYVNEGTITGVLGKQSKRAKTE